MDDQDSRRVEAIKRLNDKRDVKNNLVAYAVINTLLIVIWAVTGGGYFWPIWPLAGWGIGLALHAFSVYQRQITEDDIQAEMRIDER